MPSTLPAACRNRPPRGGVGEGVWTSVAKLIHSQLKTTFYCSPGYDLQGGQVSRNVFILQQEAMSLFMFSILLNLDLFATI